MDTKGPHGKPASSPLDPTSSTPCSRLGFGISITEYETKIADLETETDRLSQALEAQKAVAQEAQSAASKKIEELGREIQKKVLLHPSSPCLTWLIVCPVGRRG